MHLHVLIFINFIVTLLDYHTATALNETACKEMSGEIDSGIKRIMFIGADVQLPTSSEKIETYCSESKVLGKLTQKYGKCLSPFSDQIAKVLVNGVRKQIRKICKSQRSIAISNFKCMDEEYIKNAQKEAGIMLTRLRYARDNSTTDKVLPTVCCSVHGFLERLLTLAEPQCLDLSVHVSQYLHRLYANALEDVILLVCGAYPNSKACEAKAPELLRTLQNSLNVPVDLKTISLFDTAIESVSKLA